MTSLSTSPEINEFLHQTYFDPVSPGAGGGVDELWRVAVKRYPKLRRSQVRSWLRRQNVYASFRFLRHSFERRHYYVHAPLEQIEMDLMVLKDWKNFNNRKYGYALILIDCFSKMVWYRPLVTRKAKGLAVALSDIFENEMSRPPKNLRADREASFRSSEIRDICAHFKIKQFFTWQVTSPICRLHIQHPLASYTSYTYSSRRVIAFGSDYCQLPKASMVSNGFHIPQHKSHFRLNELSVR